MPFVRGSERAIPMPVPEPGKFEARRREAEPKQERTRAKEAEIPAFGAFEGYENGAERRADAPDRKFKDPEAGTYAVIRQDTPAGKLLAEDVSRKFGPALARELENIRANARLDEADKERYTKRLVEGKAGALRREHASPWSAYAGVQLVETGEERLLALFGEGNMAVYRREGRRLVPVELPSGKEEVRFLRAKAGERYLVTPNATDHLTEREIARLLEAPNADRAERLLQEAVDARSRERGPGPEAAAALVFDIPGNAEGTERRRETRGTEVPLLGDGQVAQAMERVHALEKAIFEKQKEIERLEKFERAGQGIARPEALDRLRSEERQLEHRQAALEREIESDRVRRIARDIPPRIAPGARVRLFRDGAMKRPEAGEWRAHPHPTEAGKYLVEQVGGSGMAVPDRFDLEYAQWKDHGDVPLKPGDRIDGAEVEAVQDGTVLLRESGRRRTLPKSEAQRKVMRAIEEARMASSRVRELEKEIRRRSG